MCAPSGFVPTSRTIPKRKCGGFENAGKIYYPTAFYADLFDAVGKPTFPSYHTYKCVQDKIKQSALFQLAGLPHPRTRVFYGKRQKARIREYFSYPMHCQRTAWLSDGTRRVPMINNVADLDAYILDRHIAYVQQYLPIDRDIRVVVIGSQVVHAYWRIAGEGEFRTNVAQGGAHQPKPGTRGSDCPGPAGGAGLRVGRRGDGHLLP